MTAEVSAGAVRKNLQRLRKRIGPGVKLCAVVKADCYGHGIDLLLETIASAADALAVATPEEAIALRELGYGGMVLVFFSASAFAGPAHLRDALRELIRSDITLTIVSPEEVDSADSAAADVGKRARVHIAIDTGMGRSGVPHDAAESLLRRVRAAENMRLEGLYTHFATADEGDKAFCYKQLERFKAVVSQTPSSDLLLHAANSAATMDLAESHLGMIRPGLAIYGYHPSDELHNPLELTPALHLSGKLMQVKTVREGSRCGYGLTYEFRRESRIGLVPVGYGDGYFRSLSNVAKMRVCGRLVPVVGRVSMDQTIVDLTEVPSATVGDDVEIISTDPRDPHCAENLARLAGCIPYEITCRLGRRVRRVLVE
ncbi:MAG: alanine racemase [Phycisphaerae bacterium]